MNTPSRVGDESRAAARFGWLTLFFAAWILVGLVVISYALDNGLAHDVELSPYHLPFYLALVALTLLCVALVVRAVRAGRGWRSSFPENFGVLGAGLILLLAWPIADIAWRQGVGLDENLPERVLAPSRLVILGGAMLVAVGPLRAALSSRNPGLRWPAVGSAAVIFILLGAAGLQPAGNLWLERAAFQPQASSEVWVMNADGTHQTRLIEASDGYEVGDPTWSPDGSQVVYTRWTSSERAGLQPVDVALWVAAADGSNQRLLIDGPAWDWLAHWSPDGLWIVYTVDAERGVGNGAGVAAPNFGFGLPPAAGQPVPVAPNVDIWRIRADGSGSPERLTNDPAEDRAGAYSPDEQHIVFDSTRTEGKTAIYVMNADGSNVVRQTFFGDDWGASWSPDGSRIAFQANPAGGPEDIYVLPFTAAGPVGQPIQLTNDPDPEWVPSWSADGSHIAFNSTREKQQDIWAMSSDGTNQVNLTRTQGVTESLTPGGGGWGPDGRIVYSRSQDPPAESNGFVRNYLGATVTLLGALVLAFLVFLLITISAPFGAVTVVMGLAAASVAVGNGEWRFLVAALIGGLVVDVLIHLSSQGRRKTIGTAAAATAFVLGPGLTVVATTSLGWTPTLLTGVSGAAALLAWGMTALIGRSGRVEAERTT